MDTYTSFLSTGVFLPPRFSPIAPLMKDLCHRHAISGCVLFGSRCESSFDDHSDIDLLCLGAHATELAIDSNGVNVEAIVHTENTLRAAMNRRDFRNANIALHALVNGVLIHDADFKMIRLIAEAKAIYANGPVAVTAAEITAMRSDFRKTFSHIQRLWARSQDFDRLSTGLLDVRISQAFIHAVYSYFKRRNLWCAGIPWIIRWAQINDPILGRLLDDFLGNSAVNRLNHLKDLVELSLYSEIN